MTTLELLAPARDLATAIAALRHGADAVYMGPPRFGARSGAGNSVADIARAADYAHTFGAKVYATVNTILYDNELAAAERMIVELWRAGVDALIVQDMGILEMDLPPLRLHASTQCDNRTPEQIQFLDRTGFSRAVLARELSVEQIAAMRQGTSIELEAFAHGALCVSYSGNCYLSAAVDAERSANRGACAQPCRLPYDLLDADGRPLERGRHLLSLRDLRADNHLARMVQAGVTSFKIEGRLKEAAYVKNITAYYHQKLNALVAADPTLRRASCGRVDIGFEPDPERTFNRSASTHFLDSPRGAKANLATPKSTGKAVGTVAEIGKGRLRLAGAAELHNGDGLCFATPDGMVGFQVEGADGRFYRVSAAPGLRPGAELFRNRDHLFLKAVEASEGGRTIDIEISMRPQGDTVAFQAAAPAAGAAFRLTAPLPPATSAAGDPARDAETWRRQMSKSGGTEFRVVRFDIEGDAPRRPAAQINALRRWLLDEIAKRLREKHLNERTVSEIKVAPHWRSTLDFRANVANALARRFYQRRGVTRIDDAFESTPRLSARAGTPLMTTRYCLLRELGRCRRETPAADRWKEPLYIARQGRRYALEFDCERCEMRVVPAAGAQTEGRP